MKPKGQGFEPPRGYLRDTHSNHELSLLFMKSKCVSITNKGAMAERSKAVDSRSTIFGCAGSNPAGTISGFHTATTSFFKKMKSDNNKQTKVL